MSGALVLLATQLRNVQRPWLPGMPSCLIKSACPGRVCGQSVSRRQNKLRRQTN
jgi:hypothetical protein